MLSLHRRLAGAVLLVLSLNGCNPEAGGRSDVVWISATRAIHPTAVDLVPSRGTLLIGSYRDGSVWESVPRPGTLARIRIPTAGRGLRQAIRLKVDEPRDRLWILGHGMLHLHRLSTGLSIRSLPVPARRLWAASCLPDLAIDRDGRPVISDTDELRLLVVGGEAESLEEQPLLGVPGGLHGGLSALAFTPDMRFLLAASAQSGALLRVDPRGVDVTVVSRPGTFPGACGMALTRHPERDEWMLHVSGGFHENLYAATLARDFSRLVRGPTQRRIGGTPVGLALVGSDLVISVSQLKQHADFGGDMRPFPRTWLRIERGSGLSSMSDLLECSVVTHGAPSNTDTRDDSRTSQRGCREARLARLGLALRTAELSARQMQATRRLRYRCIISARMRRARRMHLSISSLVGRRTMTWLEDVSPRFISCSRSGTAPF